MHRAPNQLAAAAAAEQVHPQRIRAERHSTDVASAGSERSSRTT